MLTIHKEIKFVQKTDGTHYLGKWYSTCHKIYLYKQYKEILAVVQDMHGKTIILSSENIKAGINGKIPRNVLFKMLKYDQDKVALTIHKTPNNNFTLWIVPKLEATGIADEHLIKKANEHETQARSTANLYKNYHNQNNFETSCNQYQQAINTYQKAYDVRKKNKEDTQAVKSALVVITKEFFLFKLDQTMADYLPCCEDQKEVKEILDIFINEENFLAFTLEIVESTQESKRSQGENFICAYVYEFLENYTLSIKSYLLLSSQYYENKDQTLSTFCLKKVEALIEKAEKTSGSFLTDFLEAVDMHWFSQIIQNLNIPKNGYLQILYNENAFKTIAYKFVKKAREKSTKYANCTHNEKTFNKVCKAYKDAFHSLKIAYDFIKDNNRNTQETEAVINKLRKEFFEFKLPQAMSLYLPSDEDQSTFRKNLSLLKDEQDFFSIILKLAKNSTEEQRSIVDNFTNAYIYEFLGKRTRMLASQNYLLLFHQYLQNQNLILSVKCLEKAETLAMEETKTSNPFAISNFLEMLDRKPIEQLLNMFPDADPNFEYLEKTLLKKDAIRITFEEYLHGFGKLSPKLENPTCFICFNVEEKDVVKWLKSTFVPDLNIMGINPIVCFRDLRPDKNLNAFQGKIRQSNLVIVICTPLLKKKCDAHHKNPTGVVQEIRLILERCNDANRSETIYPIYLKGDCKSSCPSEFFEPILETEFSIIDKNTAYNVFNYYSNAFELFGNMCGIPIEKSREIKEQFLSETKNIIFDNQVDRNKVELWRKNHIYKNKILLKSISDSIINQTEIVNFPLPPQDFTGRKKELNDLHETCKNHNTVVITGLGGIGKTALALKYADEHKSYYKFTYFISASSKDGIVQGLINLANEMNVPSGETTTRLKNLRNHLNKLESNYLLIFDGINHPEVFEELTKYLPNNKKCVLITSRIHEYVRKIQFKSLSLTSWRIEEAVEYLLTTTKKEEANQTETTKSDEHTQAEILAGKLDCLPLALIHASSYIRTRNYTICKYVEQLDKYKIELFEKKDLDIEKEEKTIFTTLQIALDAIENDHKCFIAKPLLAFFSFLGQTTIPLIVIEHWFKTFFKDNYELELGNGLHYLHNYSMIDNPSPENYFVHLSVQNVIRYSLSSDEYHNNLVQALDTLSYWIKYYDVNNTTIWPLIKIIVPHCEMLSNYLQKANDERLETEESYIFFSNISIYFQQQGALSNGLVFAKHCLNLVKKLYGTNHLNTSRTFSQVGDMLQSLGKLDEAKAYYRKSLEIKTKIYRTKNNPEIAKIIHNIGVVLQGQGKLDMAEAHYRKALEIEFKLYGTRVHIDVAKTIHNIGIVLQSQGKLDEAEAHYRKALEIEFKLYGTKDHPDVVKTKFAIATILIQQGKEEGKRVFEELRKTGLCE